MLKPVLALAITVLTIQTPLFANDHLHLNRMNCTRTTPPAVENPWGWGDIRELSFFEAVSESEKPSDKVVGLVLLSLYLDKSSGETEGRRLLVSYEFETENGVTGKIRIPSFVNQPDPKLGPANEQWLFKIPKTDTPEFLAASLQGSAKMTPIPFKCSFADPK